MPHRQLIDPPNEHVLERFFDLPGQMNELLLFILVEQCSEMSNKTPHPIAARTTPPNPVVRQGLQVVEYLTLAAVVPLAAWVAGVYGMVRDLSLP